MFFDANKLFSRKKKMDAKFASTNFGRSAVWAESIQLFTNSSQKGLLYVQVGYKYSLSFTSEFLQVH